VSTQVLEAARAERERLEERCAWHLGQLDRTFAGESAWGEAQLVELRLDRADHARMDVKVGRVGESIESGKSYRVTDGEFEEAK
jgi:hypothetical protein